MIGTGKKGCGSKNRLCVMTFNLRFGLADDGPNAWPHRREAVAQLFRSHPAEILGVQEANDFQTEFISGILPGYQMIGCRRPAPRFWQNNVVFYRREWVCRQHRHLFLSPTPDLPSRFPESRWPRQCTIGLLEKNQRKLLVVNTHLDFDSEVQMRAARIIMDALSEFPSGVPALWLGDFNAVPGSAVYRLLTGQDPGDKPFAAFTMAYAPPFPATHHRFTGSRKGDHIDWILYRDMAVESPAEILQDRFNGRFPSDHFPVKATFC